LDHCWGRFRGHTGLKKVKFFLPKVPEKKQGAVNKAAHDQIGLTRILGLSKKKNGLRGWTATRALQENGCKKNLTLCVAGNNPISRHSQAETRMAIQIAPDDYLGAFSTQKGQWGQEQRRSERGCAPSHCKAGWGI